MPNIKSAKKRDALSKAQNAANRAARSALRTTIKKFELAVKGSDKAVAADAYAKAIKAIDRAAGKGLLHKNNAAHKKSQITLAFNANS